MGQRHVFLNPRRAGDIRALIERGRGPTGAATALPLILIRAMSLPGQIATQVKTKLQTLATLTSAGIVRPARPDRLLTTAVALARWGPTPAAGYTASAARYPNDVGIVDELGTLTFEQIHERTNALANALRKEGVGEGDGVAIMCRNHRGFIETVVACSKLGANALFLNTAFSKPAADRRARARGARRARLRRGVRRAARRRRRRPQALHRVARPRRGAATTRSSRS